MGDNIHYGNVETKSGGRRNCQTPPVIAKAMRSLGEELQSFIEYNERLVKAKEDQNQLNDNILQSLKNIQRKISHGSSPNNFGRNNSKGHSHMRSYNSRTSSCSSRRSSQDISYRKSLLRYFYSDLDSSGGSLSSLCWKYGCGR